MPFYKSYSRRETKNESEGKKIISQGEEQEGGRRTGETYDGGRQ